MEAFGAIFAALIGGAITLLVNYKNEKDRERQNRENQSREDAINKQNLDYATANTQAQWERDDTAHQREVADLQKAGLSPLASLNGSNVSPAIVGGPVQGIYQYEAPQADVNSIMQSVLGISDIFSRTGELQNKIDTLNFEKAKHGDDVAFKAIELEQTQETINQGWSEIENVTRELNIQDERVQSEIDSINNSIRISKETLAEEIAHNREVEDREYENNRYIRINERIIKELPDGMRYKACFDDISYQSSMETFFEDYKAALIDVFGSDVRTGILEDGTNQTSFINSSGSNGSTAGVLSLGANSTKSYTRDLSKAQNERWQKKLSELRFPIRFSSDDRDLFDDDGILKSYSKRNNYRD